jgi:hypothetical protein
MKGMPSSSSPSYICVILNLKLSSKPQHNLVFPSSWKAEPMGTFQCRHRMQQTCAWSHHSNLLWKQTVLGLSVIVEDVLGKQNAPLLGSEPVSIPSPAWSRLPARYKACSSSFHQLLITMLIDRLYENLHYEHWYKHIASDYAIVYINSLSNNIVYVQYMSRTTLSNNIVYVHYMSRITLPKIQFILIFY